MIPPSMFVKYRIAEKTGKSNSYFQEEQAKEEALKEKLYLQLRKRSLRYAYFMFFDVESYLADQLFIRYNIRVWFDAEYAKEGSPYRAILCHVRKKDVPEFLAALEELKKSMLICGYEDYEAYVSAYMDEAERAREEILNGKNDTAGQAIQGQQA